MIMTKTDATKIISSTSVVVLSLLGLVMLITSLTQNSTGFIFSVILAFILLCLIIWFVYPFIFKDYIERFWQEEERKRQEREAKEAKK